MSRANPEEAILELLIDAYLRASPLRQRDDRPHRPERIVGKAEERFLASLEKKVSLADLCVATGVSKSTLYRAFDIVCGVPQRDWGAATPIENRLRRYAYTYGFPASEEDVDSFQQSNDTLRNQCQCGT
jgi:hypothetical protein